VIARVAKVSLPLLFVCALFTMTSACGYKPLRSSLEGHPRVHVLHANVRVPDGANGSAATEAETGARAELAKWGALDDGDVAADRLTIEIVRIDERSEGETVVPGAFGDKPIARGVRVRVTARGDVEGNGGAFATPDIDVTETVATPSGDALAWDAARTAAVKAAARKAGAQVARTVLGIP
jgi:hypothetical protein